MTPVHLILRRKGKRAKGEKRKESSQQVLSCASVVRRVVGDGCASWLEYKRPVDIKILSELKYASSTMLQTYIFVEVVHILQLP
jgi:hypothetical protein